MNPFSDSEDCSTLACRPSRAAAPVLISLPAVSRSHRPGRPTARRRRLRREVRVAGLLILGLVPASVALSALGGARPSSKPTMLAIANPFPLADATEARADEPEASRQPVRISLAPMLSTASTREAAECSVMLSGQLLPADSPEDATHGGL